MLSLALPAAAAAAYSLYYLYATAVRAQSRFLASKWRNQEEQEFGHETLHSIIEHFKDFSLSKTSTVKEANQRRTLSYYLKAREAHKQSLVLGFQEDGKGRGNTNNSNHDKLVQARKEEIDDTILKYYRKGTKSHRTVIVMLDHLTASLLHEARRHILAPLQYSHDPETHGVWIPTHNMIPPSDMHITVSIPWWWHSMLPDADDNYELSQAIANRFRQALVLDFHHPFQLELERIILLGGKTLVALWRTIGERLVVEDHHVIQDRHGTDIDPMVRLRREIVQCFTTENEDIQRKPLTYHAHKKSLLDQEQDLIQQVFNLDMDVVDNGDDTSSKGGIPHGPNPRSLSRSNSLPQTASPIRQRRRRRPPPPDTPDRDGRPPLERQPTIELKTPGMGDGDGFIHTTLCRLPLDCLSMTDVELEPIHRLCREATAMYAGHRMVVHRFRFLETTGEGGDSNPCVAPIFDETMEAPTRVTVDASGQITRVGSHHATHTSMNAYYSNNNNNNHNGTNANTDPMTMTAGRNASDFGATTTSGSIWGSGRDGSGRDDSSHGTNHSNSNSFLGVAAGGGGNSTSNSKNSNQSMQHLPYSFMRRVESRNATIGALPPSPQLRPMMHASLFDEPPPPVPPIDSAGADPTTTTTSSDK
jgi:hypothetical protein